MKIEIEIPDRTFALLKGLAAYNGLNLPQLFTDMVGDRLEVYASDIEREPLRSAHHPPLKPLKVKVRR